jgi:hypothetical protein
MFRLIRLPLILLVAFICGVVYERGQQRDLCAQSGGNWSAQGYCTR